MATLTLLILLTSWTPDDLVTFCTLGKVEELRRAVNEGASVSAPGKQGETPLVAASSHRQTELVAFLLQRGADPNQTGRSGKSALEEAAWDGELEIMRLLLQAGADPNLGTSSMPPIYTAVLSGKAEAVELLLEHGAMATPDISESPIQRAAMAGYSEIVDHLLRAGAEPDKLSKEGLSPLHQAAKRGHYACVEVLLSAGAEPELLSKYGATAFELAATQGHEEAAKKLLVSVSRLDTGLEASCTGGLFELTQVLLERGAQPTEYCYKAAAEHHGSQFLKALSENSSIKPPLSALPAAARIGNTEGAEYLLSLGLSVESTDKQGATPLLLAAAHGHLELVELLLQFDADPMAQDHQGRGAEELMKAHQGFLEAILQDYSRSRRLHPRERELRETLEAYKRNRPKILKLLGGRED